jgi:hypothetical protein
MKRAEIELACGCLLSASIVLSIFHPGETRAQALDQEHRCLKAVTLRRVFGLLWSPSAAIAIPKKPTTRFIAILHRSHG